MFHPITFPILKFAVRHATAFVGHSFAEEDEDIVGRLIEFFSKLGVACDSGKRAEPTSVSDKVRKRIVTVHGSEGWKTSSFAGPWVEKRSI